MFFLSYFPQVDNLFFSSEGTLKDEFTRIFNSLFKHSGKYIKLVITLGEKRMGLTRDEIVELSKLNDGGAKDTLCLQTKPKHAKPFIQQ